MKSLIFAIAWFGAACSNGTPGGNAPAATNATSPHPVAASSGQASGAASGTGASMTAPPGSASSAAVENVSSIDAAIAEVAKRNVPGAEDAGGVAAVGTETGGSAGSVVRLEPGVCYTLIGWAAAGGVTHLEVKLIGPSFRSITGHKPLAGKEALVIVPKPPACLDLKISEETKFDLTVVAKEGAGKMGARLFAIKK